MTKREERVINAFCNCVRDGEFSEAYAVTLLEDMQRYGWVSAAAKEVFYDFLDTLPEPESEPAAQEVAPGGAGSPQTGDNGGDEEEPGDDEETPTAPAEGQENDDPDGGEDE